MTLRPLEGELIDRLNAMVDNGAIDEMTMVLTVGAYNTYVLHPSLWPDVENDPTISLPVLEEILLMAGIEIPWKRAGSISSDLAESPRE